jgi:hypothetical protein
VSDGERVAAGHEEAGDEPACSRICAGRADVVGKDRRKSGRLAVERFAPDVIVWTTRCSSGSSTGTWTSCCWTRAVPFDNGTCCRAACCASRRRTWRARAWIVPDPRDLA